MSPNRVCGTTDKTDRDRNSPTTKYHSMCGSEIDIVQRDSCEMISYMVLSRQIVSYMSLRIDLYRTWALVGGIEGNEKGSPMYLQSM